MAFDAYLKIDSIPGDSPDKGHEQWIPILAFNHGVTQPHSSSVAGGGSRSGVERCDHLNFSIVKAIDKATPKLNLHCCNGKNLNKVKIEICKQAENSKVAYMTYEFENCLIRSVSISRPPDPTSASGASDTSGSHREREIVPTETVHFSYSKITWKYTEIENNQPKGNSVSYWDMLSNTGG